MKFMEGWSPVHFRRIYQGRRRKRGVNGVKPCPPRIATESTRQGAGGTASGTGGTAGGTAGAGGSTVSVPAAVRA